VFPNSNSAKPRNNVIRLELINEVINTSTELGRAIVSTLPPILKFEYTNPIIETRHTLLHATVHYMSFKQFAEFTSKVSKVIPVTGHGGL
jgi:hypothetical protein